VNVSAFDAYRPGELQMKESIWYWQNPQGYANNITNPFCAQLPGNKKPVHISLLGTYCIHKPPLEKYGQHTP
jgi:hypothetical protein